MTEVHTVAAATVTVVVALADPDAAVIDAVPFATAVTRPADDTVATAAFDVAHVTVALAIVAPFWSLTVAVSWVVAVSEAKVSWESDNSTLVATGVGVEVVGVEVEVSVPELGLSWYHRRTQSTTELCLLTLYISAYKRPVVVKC